MTPIMTPIKKVILCPLCASAVKKFESALICENLRLIFSFQVSIFDLLLSILSLRVCCLLFLLCSLRSALCPKSSSLCTNRRSGSCSHSNPMQSQAMTPYANEVRPMRFWTRKRRPDCRPPLSPKKPAFIVKLPPPEKTPMARGTAN